MKIFISISAAAGLSDAELFRAMRSSTGKAYDEYYAEAVKRKLVSDVTSIGDPAPVPRIAPVDKITGKGVPTYALSGQREELDLNSNQITGVRKPPRIYTE